MCRNILLSLKIESRPPAALRLTSHKIKGPAVFVSYIAVTKIRLYITATDHLNAKRSELY